MGKITKVVPCLLAAVLLCSCGEQKEYKPIADVNNLEGRRIGVTLAWGPDYLLTGRDDMTLVRYNSVSNMVTAMCYNRVDAIAIEKPFASQVLSCVEGMRMVEEPIGVDGMVACFAKSRQDVLDEFNDFIVEFQKTAEYEDLLERFQSDDIFQPVEVEKAGGDKKLKVAICADNYPFTYLNFQTGEYEGCDIEVIQHFANAYGYELEFVNGTYESNEMAIYYETLDVFISGFSDLYRSDVEISGVALLSEIYLPSEIVLIEPDGSGDLEIKSTIAF